MMTTIENYCIDCKAVAQPDCESRGHVVGILGQIANEQPRSEQGSGTQSKVIDQLLDIAIYAEDIDRRVAARVQIVKMLDQHSTLIAQRERLREALYEALSYIGAESSGEVQDQIRTALKEN